MAAGERLLLELSKISQRAYAFKETDEKHLDEYLVTIRGLYGCHIYSMSSNDVTVSLTISCLIEKGSLAEQNAFYDEHVNYWFWVLFAWYTVHETWSYFNKDDPYETTVTSNSLCQKLFDNWAQNQW